MGTLKQAKERATELKANNIKHFPRIIVWIEKTSNDFVVYQNLSGLMQPNPLENKRIYI
jgi:hypothetical protein